MFYLLLLFAFYLLNSFSGISERLFQTHMVLTWQSINYGLMCQRPLKGPWRLHKYIHQIYHPRSKFSVMFTKKVFIAVANSFSSVLSWLFYFSISLLEFNPLLLKIVLWFSKIFCCLINLLHLVLDSTLRLSEGSPEGFPNFSKNIS